MGRTNRKPKYKRDRFDGEAAMERARQEGSLSRGHRDQDGDWVGKDTRGHNQQFYDECVAAGNPMTCPCKKCERKVKEGKANVE